MLMQHITDTGAVALSKMLLENKSLRILDLYGISVTSCCSDGQPITQSGAAQLRLPRELKAYCKQLALYGRVNRRIRL